MKTIARLLLIIGSLAVGACAEFAGNGVSVGVSYEDPANGLSVDLHTAK